MVRPTSTTDIDGLPNPGSLQNVFEQCRRLGMRLSRQRRMVLDLLWSEKSHLSARDIFEKLKLKQILIKLPKQYNPNLLLKLLEEFFLLQN